MRQKTIAGIRKNNVPAFISLASEESAFALEAFHDVGNGAMILAKSGKKRTYSPISGKSMETMSVGEIASSTTDMQDYVVVASCDNIKCKCKTYTTKDLAKMLVASGEKEIFCTACGQAMPIVATAAEEDEDIVEDEVGDDVADEDSDEDVVADDDEDAVEGDDASKSEDDDGSDPDEDVMMDDDGDDAVEDEEDSTSDEEMSEDEEEPEEDIDAEVAKLLAEVASEIDTEDNTAATDADKPQSEQNDVDQGQSDVSVAYVLHNVDFATGKSRVVFHNPETAWLTHTATDNPIERQVGVFNRAKASPESTKLYDNRDVFGKTVSHLLASGALANEQPSEEMVKLGFEPITVQVPLSQSQAKMINTATAAAKQVAMEQASTQIADIANNFDKLLAVAAVGLDKGILGNASLHRELSSMLARMGTRKSDVVARQFCENHVRPFLNSVIAQAKELAAKDPVYVQGLSETIAKAVYATIEDPNAPEQMSTALVNPAPISEVASLDVDRPGQRHPVANTRIQDALRRMGSGRR